MKETEKNELKKIFNKLSDMHRSGMGKGSRTSHSAGACCKF